MRWWVTATSHEVVGHGLSEEKLSKEEMRKQAHLERNKVMYDHHRAECAVETWSKMYDGGRPSYLFFMCTSTEPKVKQLEETLAVVDECERDFAADLAHFEEITAEEAMCVVDAGRSALSTPATGVGNPEAMQAALPGLKVGAQCNPNPKATPFDFRFTACHCRSKLRSHSSDSRRHVTTLNLSSRIY